MSYITRVSAEAWESVKHILIPVVLLRYTLQTYGLQRKHSNLVKFIYIKVAKFQKYFYLPSM